MKTIHVITGQTATGKTAYALQKASELNGEIINFDSRQIYKHLDIVTGKDVPRSSFIEVSKAQSFTTGYYEVLHNGKTIKLWLYDIVDPKQRFSSFDFEKLCLPLLKDMFERGVTPILVGGTYLYLYFLLYGDSKLQEPNWKLREELENETVESLQERVKKENPAAFEKMNQSDRMNPHRLMRVLEKPDYTGEFKHEMTLANKLKMESSDIEVVIEGLLYSDTEMLRAALQKRVETRLENGAVEEVKELFIKGYSIDDPGLQSIGYQQISDFLENKTTYSEMVQQWTTKEYQYAKRQKTFMKKNPFILWKNL